MLARIASQNYDMSRQASGALLAGATFAGERLVLASFQLK